MGYLAVQSSYHTSYTFYQNYHFFLNFFSKLPKSERVIDFQCYQHLQKNFIIYLFQQIIMIWYKVLSFDRKLLLDNTYSLEICKSDDYYNPNRAVYKQLITFENKERYRTFLQMIKLKGLIRIKEDVRVQENLSYTLKEDQFQVYNKESKSFTPLKQCRSSYMQIDSSESSEQNNLPLSPSIILKKSKKNINYQQKRRQCNRYKIDLQNMTKSNQMLKDELSTLKKHQTQLKSLKLSYNTLSTQNQQMKEKIQKLQGKVAQLNGVANDKNAELDKLKQKIYILKAPKRCQMRVNAYAAIKKGYTFQELLGQNTFFEMEIQRLQKKLQDLKAGRPQQQDNSRYDNKSTWQRRY